MSENEIEACCADLSNRSEPKQVGDDERLEVTYCTCGRRHFVLNVDPAELGATGLSL